MIVVRLKGGMGNQMFQYALGRALSLKYNVPLRFNIEAYEDTGPRPFRSLYPGSFTQRTYDLDLFTIAGQVATKKEIPFLHRMYGKGPLFLIFDAVRRRILRYVFKQKAQELYYSEYKSEYLDLGPNAYLDGFYQSPKYFEHIADTIRKDFSFKDPVPSHVTTLAETMKQHNSVCVHFRRTDFVGNSAYDYVGDEYYKNALDYIAQKTHIDTIYVFSDDIEWCKQNLSYPHPTVIVGNEYAGDRNQWHFYLMRSCKHFIIPNSSFSWWAAWLPDHSDKIVVAPNYWFTDTDIHDVIPDQWKIL